MNQKVIVTDKSFLLRDLGFTKHRSLLIVRLSIRNSKFTIFIAEYSIEISRKALDKE